MNPIMFLVDLIGVMLTGLGLISIIRAMGLLLRIRGDTTKQRLATPELMKGYLYIIKVSLSAGFVYILGVFGTVGDTAHNAFILLSALSLISAGIFFGLRHSLSNLS